MTTTCPHCDRRVEVLRDGTFRLHTATAIGVNRAGHDVVATSGGKPRAWCVGSGTEAPK